MLRLGRGLPLAPLLFVAIAAVVSLGFAAFPAASGVISDAATKLYIEGVEYLAPAALIALAVVAAGAALIGWRKERVDGVRLVAVFAAVALAYTLSESLKALVVEPRPCHGFAYQVMCPPEGDWSFPSNHTTVGFALLAVIVSLAPHVVVSVVAGVLALVIGTGRVLELVHYPHDVAAAAVLGLMTVFATSAVVDRVMRRRRGPSDPGGRDERADA